MDPDLVVEKVYERRGQDGAMLVRRGSRTTRGSNGDNVSGGKIFIVLNYSVIL